MPSKRHLYTTVADTDMFNFEVLQTEPDGILYCPVNLVTKETRKSQEEAAGPFSYPHPVLLRGLQRAKTATQREPLVSPAQPTSGHPASAAGKGATAPKWRRTAEQQAGRLFRCPEEERETLPGCKRLGASSRLVRAGRRGVESTRRWTAPFGALVYV